MELTKFPPNQVKKLFDLEENRRVRCRHWNAFLPKLTPRIYITNSEKADFFPKMNNRDKAGVMRRQRFVTVERDLRPPSVPCHEEGVIAVPAQEQTCNDLNPALESHVVAFLEKAHLLHKKKQCLAWCSQMGVALIQEFKAASTDIAIALQLKPMEMKRFQATGQ